MQVDGVWDFGLMRHCALIGPFYDPIKRADFGTNLFLKKKKTSISKTKYKVLHRE